jgi:hypothetical protein
MVLGTKVGLKSKLSSEGTTQPIGLDLVLCVVVVVDYWPLDSDFVWVVVVVAGEEEEEDEDCGRKRE